MIQDGMQGNDDGKIALCQSSKMEKHSKPCSLFQTKLKTKTPTFGLNTSALKQTMKNNL